MSSMLFRAGAVALTLSACADTRLDTPSVEATSSPNGTVIVDPLPPPPPVPAKGVRVLTTTADGAAATVFDRAESVNIVTDGVNVEGDYSFDVTAIVRPPNEAADTVFLTTDPVACRTFHIGASGHIDGVLPGFDASGTRCDRAVSGDAATGLVLHLMPYDLGFDSIVETDASGNRIYSVRIVPVGDTLSVQGASAVFSIEPPPPVCGNGIVEPGEECDDGNLTCGDGCSETCQNENANMNM